jgi:hypothetical protein
MIPVNVNPVLIRKELLEAWCQITQAGLAALLETPDCNLGHLEELLEAQSKELMRPILQAAAQHLAGQQPFQCSVCQTPLRAENQDRPRDVDTVFGSFVLKRQYGWCPTCDCYCHPADQALGLAPHAPASPRVQEIAALMGIRLPFAQAAQDARRLTGVALTPTRAFHEARRQGQRTLQLRQRDLDLLHDTQGVAALSARSGTDQHAPFTLVIEIDAWNIRERDHWGQTRKMRHKGMEPERWHWVFTATIFLLDHRGQTQGKRRVISQRGYVATREGLDAFTRQLYAEAILRGLLNASEVLIIADGAIWIWNLANDRFKGAKQRVDLFHVREHLHGLARALYGEDSPQSQQWLEPLLRFLDRRKNGALDVLRTLEDLRQNLQHLTVAQQEALDKEIGYFTTHQTRMDYKAAIAKGEPVGSGAVESTARQYQTRFKCTGQFWSLQGDESLLALATLYRNQRWHLLFPHTLPAPNN